MSSNVLRCTKCDIPLPASLINTPDFSSCPKCKVTIRASAFPALFRETPPPLSDNAIMTDSEASCFYHPAKKAVVPCDLCGRFLCALCEIEFNSQHVCSSCLEAGKKKRKIRNLEHSRVLHDNIALYLAIIPLLFVWPTIITAPASIYYAIRHWRSPSSIIPRTKVRFIVSVFISAIQIIAWGLLFTGTLTS